MKSKLDNMGTNPKFRKCRQGHTLIDPVSRFKRRLCEGDLICRVGTSGIPRFGQVTQGSRRSPQDKGSKYDKETIHVQWLKQRWNFSPEFEETPLEENCSADGLRDAHIVDRNIRRDDYVWKDGIRGRVLRVEVAATLRDINSTKLVIYEVPAGLITPSPNIRSRQMVYLAGWIGQIMKVHVKYKIVADKYTHCLLSRVSRSIYDLHGNLKRVKCELYEGDVVHLNKDIIMECEWVETTGNDETTYPSKKSIVEKFEGSKATVESMIIDFVEIDWIDNVESSFPESNNNLWNTQCRQPPKSIICCDDLALLKIMTLPEKDNISVGCVGLYKVRPEDTISHLASWSAFFTQQTLYPDCIADSLCQNLNHGELNQEETKMVEVMCTRKLILVEWEMPTWLPTQLLASEIDQIEERSPLLKYFDKEVTYHVKSTLPLSVDGCEKGDGSFGSDHFGFLRSWDENGVFTVDWYFYSPMCFTPAHGLLLSEKVSKYDIQEHQEFSHLKPGAVVSRNLSEMEGFFCATVMSVLDNGMLLLRNENGNYFAVWPQHVRLIQPRWTNETDVFCVQVSVMRQWMNLLHPYCEINNLHISGAAKTPFKFWELAIDSQKIASASDQIFEYQFQISSLPYAPHTHMFSDFTPGGVFENGYDKFRDALFEERKAIENNLFPGVFVRYFQDREDLISLLILPSEKSVYHYMVFMFDIYLPPSFPDADPGVAFVSPIPDHIHEELCSDGTIFTAPKKKSDSGGSEGNSLFSVVDVISALKESLEVSPFSHDIEPETTEEILVRMVESCYSHIANPHDPWMDFILPYYKQNLPLLYQRCMNLCGSDEPCIDDSWNPKSPVTEGFKIAMDKRWKLFGNLLS